MAKDHAIYSFCEDGILLSKVEFEKPYPVLKSGCKYKIITNIVIGNPRKSTATIKEIK